MIFALAANGGSPPDVSNGHVCFGLGAVIYLVEADGR